MSTQPLPGSAEEHPGLELNRLLKERHLNGSDTADAAGLSRPLLSQIINARRRITPTSAYKICQVIGGDPMFWIKRQQEHDLWLKEEQIKEHANSLAVAGH